MNHVLTIVRTIPMDASSPVFWSCDCGAVGDEDWPNADSATAHYNAVHAVD